MTDLTTTMKLNHLSFPSTDVEATAGFFEKHLGCTATVFGTSRLLKRPGFDIVIEDASDLAVDWPHNFHLGFELPTVNDVRRLHDRFKAAGVQMETDVIGHVRGSRFFCRAPGGVMFEINTRSDAAEPYRGTFDNWG
jgi:catechol 2,3-dioxygenase-like lactoylglutathione lyase family enzyme